MRIETHLEYSVVGELPDGAEWRQEVDGDARTFEAILADAAKAAPAGVSGLRVERRRVSVQTGSWRPV